MSETAAPPPASEIPADHLSGVVKFQIGATNYEIDLDQIYAGNFEEDDYLRLLSHSYQVWADARDDAEFFVGRLTRALEEYRANQYLRWRAHYEDKSQRATEALLQAHIVIDEGFKGLSEKLVNAERNYKKAKLVCDTIWHNNGLVKAKQRKNHNEDPPPTR